MEIWKDIPNWEGLYQASNFGRIRSCAGRRLTKYPNGKILKPIPRYNRGGYLAVNLTNGKNTRRQIFVHKLIAITFLKKEKSDLQVCHNDGNNINNNLSNLRWDTSKNNHKDRIRHGRTSKGQKNGNHKLTDEQSLYIIESNKKPKELAKMFNVNKNTITYTKKYKIYLLK